MKNIHILPTDKPSRLQLNKHNKIFLSEELKLYSDCINQNIYITSDEEIKEGWSGYAFKEDVEGKVFKHFYTQNEWYKDAKKIILTTDQDLIKDGVQFIDDDFLEWFVKNPSCLYAIVDKEEDFYEIFMPNINIEDEIIIPKEGLSPFDLQESPMTDNEFYQSLEKPKQETLEEIAERLNLLGRELYALKLGAKWQQEQDKNKYSEEEVFEIIALFVNDAPHNTKEWFEQFKNK